MNFGQKPGVARVPGRRVRSIMFFSCFSCVLKCMCFYGQTSSWSRFFTFCCRVVPLCKRPGALFHAFLRASVPTGCLKPCNLRVPAPPFLRIRRHFLTFCCGGVSMMKQPGALFHAFIRAFVPTGCLKPCNLRVPAPLGCRKPCNLRVPAPLGCLKPCNLRVPAPSVL